MTTENNPHGFNHSFPWVYEAEQGKFVEYSDYARLKAEVAKWWNTHMPPIDNHIAQLEAENARLKAEVERLTKAGDNMYSWLGVCGRHNNSTGDDWLRAKKGLPSLTEQWEIEKRNRAEENAAKEGKDQP
jgi:hypothetical protein